VKGASNTHDTPGDDQGNATICEIPRTIGGSECRTRWWTRVLVGELADLRQPRVGDETESGTSHDARQGSKIEKAGTTRHDRHASNMFRPTIIAPL
jgi:hypothetical protein